MKVEKSSNVNKVECKPPAVRLKTKLKKKFFHVNTHHVLSHRFIPSEHAKHINLFIESEKQIYNKNCKSLHGTTYKCRVKRCNCRVLVHGNRCYKKIGTAPHNHPDVDDRKIKELEALEDLRKKVESMAFELTSPRKWNELLAEFSAQNPNFDCKKYLVSLQRIRKRKIEASSSTQTSVEVFHSSPSLPLQQPSNFKIDQSTASEEMPQFENDLTAIGFEESELAIPGEQKQYLQQSSPSTLLERKITKTEISDNEWSDRKQMIPVFRFDLDEVQYFTC